MNTQSFLEQYIFSNSLYELTADDAKTIIYEGIEPYIFRKLNRSSYKATGMPPALLEKVQNIIKKSVQAKMPIHVTVPFGGYKKWQLPTAPGVDWAEVFNVVLLREYLSPIAVAYDHGVILHYVSDEVFIARMNNYSQNDIDTYNRQFEELINMLKKFMPENMTIRYSKIRDEISQEEILERFDKTIIRLRQEWDTLSEETKTLRLEKSDRNYCGDLGGLTDEQKYRVLLDSTLVHDAFIDGEWEQGVTWAFGEYMIPVGFRYTGDWGIHLRSSRSSTVQFWIGVGAIKKTKDEYIPTIFTYNQYEALKNSLCTESIDLFPKKLDRLHEILTMNE